MKVTIAFILPLADRDGADYSAEKLNAFTAVVGIHSEHLFVILDAKGYWWQTIGKMKFTMGRPISLCLATVPEDDEEWVVENLHSTLRAEFDLPEPWIMVLGKPELK